MLHLNRIKLRHGGVTVQTMSIEIEERRFGVTRDGDPYPPILRVDDNFETPSQARRKSARPELFADTPLFEDGSVTLGDKITTGLWQ